MKKLLLALVLLSSFCAVKAQNGVPSGGANGVPNAAPAVAGTIASGDVAVGAPSGTQVQDSGVGMGYGLISTQTASSSAALQWTNLGTYANYTLSCNALIPSTSGQSLNLRYSEDNGTTWKSANYSYVGTVLPDNSTFSGTFSANSGTPVVVSNVNVQATSLISITLKTVGGTPAAPWLTAITAGTGFTVNSGASDTSTYNYFIQNNLPQNSSSASAIQVSGPVSSAAATSSTSTTVTIRNLASTTVFKQLVSTGSGAQSGPHYQVHQFSGTYTGDAGAVNGIEIFFGSGSIASGTCSLYGSVN